MYRRVHGTATGGWNHAVLASPRSPNTGGATGERSWPRPGSPPGEGVDFLGFHHRLVRTYARRGTKQTVFLARWPARKATQHARDRIRELTARSRLRVPVDGVVGQVNLFLRGWAEYFRYGNSTRAFEKIMAYSEERLALFVGKRVPGSSTPTGPSEDVGVPVGISRSPGCLPKRGNGA
ncbi:MAG: group II intron maturase-specific domain-containing protein [Frankiaceae bacterium]